MNGLPDIHEWYPKLSIDAKHALQDDGPLNDDVRAEISEICGFDIPVDASLGDADRDYIRTQGEPVD